MYKKLVERFAQIVLSNAVSEYDCLKYRTKTSGRDGDTVWCGDCWPHTQKKVIEPLREACKDYSLKELFLIVESIRKKARQGARAFVGIFIDEAFKDFLKCEFKGRIAEVPDCEVYDCYRLYYQLLGKKLFPIIYADVRIFRLLIQKPSSLKLSDAPTGVMLAEKLLPPWAWCRGEWEFDYRLHNWSAEGPFMERVKIAAEEGLFENLYEYLKPFVFLLECRYSDFQSDLPSALEAIEQKFGSLLLVENKDHGSGLAVEEGLFGGHQVFFDGVYLGRYVNIIKQAASQDGAVWADKIRLEVSHKYGGGIHYQTTIWGYSKFRGGSPQVLYEHSAWNLDDGEGHVRDLRIEGGLAILKYEFIGRHRWGGGTAEDKSWVHNASFPLNE